MGPTGKFHPFPGSINPKLKEKKPAKDLRLSSVGVAESQNTTAFSGQDALKGIKKNLPIPMQNYPGYSIKKKKIKSSQDSAKQNYKF
jgi:hypothetical protein